jgi:hypothetical protein
MFARRAMREEREKQELADLRTTAAPVKLGMLRGQSRRLSLRTAASELVERLGGEIRVEDGSLVMLAPPFSTLSGRDVRATRTNRRARYRLAVVADRCIHQIASLGGSGTRSRRHG